MQIASPNRECAGTEQEYCARSRPRQRSIFQFESTIRSARIVAAVLWSRPKLPMGWKMDGTSVFFDPQELGPSIGDNIGKGSRLRRHVGSRVYCWRGGDGPGAVYPS